MTEGRYPSRAGLVVELTFEVNGNTLSLLKLKDYSVSWNPMHETGQRGGALLSKVAKGIASLIDKGMPMLSIEYRWADPGCILTRKPTELEMWLSGTKLIVLDGSRFISQQQLDSFPCNQKKGNVQCKGRGLKAGDWKDNARSSKGLGIEGIHTVFLCSRHLNCKSCNHKYLSTSHFDREVCAMDQEVVNLSL